MITQAEIEKLSDDKDKLGKAKKRLRTVEMKIAEREGLLLNRVQKQEKVEKGVFSVFAHQVEKRASISWKDIVIKLKGVVYAQKLLDDAVRDVTWKLILKRRGG